MHKNRTQVVLNKSIRVMFYFANNSPNNMLLIIFVNTEFADNLFFLEIIFFLIPDVDRWAKLFILKSNFDK